MRSVPSESAKLEPPSSPQETPRARLNYAGEWLAAAIPLSLAVVAGAVVVLIGIFNGDVEHIAWTIIGVAAAIGLWRLGIFELFK
jgi:hypothetical protein